MKRLEYLKPPKLLNQGVLPWLQQMLGWADQRFVEVEDVLSGKSDSPLGRLATPPPALPNKPTITWFRSFAAWLSEEIATLREIFTPVKEAQPAKEIGLLPEHREEVQ